MLYLEILKTTVYIVQELLAKPIFFEAYSSTSTYVNLNNVSNLHRYLIVLYLKYCHQAWSIYIQNDVDNIDKVQLCNTKRILKAYILNYLITCSWCNLHWTIEI